MYIYLYMCVFVYVYMYIYIYMYIYTSSFVEASAITNTGISWISCWLMMMRGFITLCIQGVMNNVTMYGLGIPIN